MMMADRPQTAGSERGTHRSRAWPSCFFYFCFVSLSAIRIALEAVSAEESGVEPKKHEGGALI